MGRSVHKYLINNDTQAGRVIAKFGGVRKLALALKIADPYYARTPSSIYRWVYPKSRGGTGGVIPTDALIVVLKAARIEGIVIGPDDLYPSLEDLAESVGKL